MPRADAWRSTALPSFPAVVGSLTIWARSAGCRLSRSPATASFVWHGLGGDGPLPAEGDLVEGRIDWDRRHALMRTHTALHVLSAVIWRDHEAKVTGASMEPLRGRMDFELEGLSGELVREIEARVNEEVAADRPVSVDFLPREEADRRPELIRTKVSLLPDVDHGRPHGGDRRARPAGRRRHARRENG